MPTLAVVIARQPLMWRNRYGDSYWINWMNDLLEKLSSETALMPTLDLETGVKVDNLVWIDKPAGCREVTRISYPRNLRQQYAYEEVNNRIRLTNVEVAEQEEVDTATAFQNYTTTSIEVNIDDAAADEYKDYIMVVTAGTFLNNTYVLKGNDAAAAGYTKLEFRNPLTTALDGTKVTAIQLIAPAYYVMMRYGSSFTPLTLTSEEVPINDKFERRITKSWLRFCAEEESSETSDNAQYWDRKFKSDLKDIKGERRVVPGRIKPRYIPGLRQYQRVN